MTELSVDNLVTYSAQVMVVVATGAAGAQLFRLPFARARLSYWRLIVAACLILPLFPARSIDVVFTEQAIDAASAAVMDDLEAPVITAPLRVSWLSLLPLLLVAGAAGRAAWIGIGLISLGRLRRQGQTAVLDDDVEVLRKAVAPTADLRWHDRIAQPITFGWRRPVVLLPRRIAELPVDAQRAVVCHELLHVARRDWAWLLVEEAIQCAFWFHPGMWWALSQVQLSREETVDEQVIRITSARRSYMSALVMFSGETATVAPAMSFIRRRHLVSRIKHLSQEHAMSPLRVACAATALAAVVVGASGAAAASLPLQARELIALPAPVTVSLNPVALRPVTPAAVTSLTVKAQDQGAAETEQRKAATAIEEKMARTAQLRAHLELAEAARKLEAASDAQRELEVQHRQVLIEQLRLRGQLGQAVVYRVAPVYPEAAKGHVVDAVVTVRITVGLAGEVTDVEAVRTRLSTESDVTDPGYWASQPSRAFAQAAEDAVRQWRFEPSGSTRTFELPVSFTPSQAVVVSQPSPNRLRVGANIRPPVLIARAAPEYPAAARAARVQGVVVLELVLATDGSVSETRVLRSIPLLDQAAVDAVRQWRYAPTLLNGQPVELLITVTVNFTLPPEPQ